MGLTKLALKMALLFPDVESFDNILLIGPHPDDIEIGAGATVAKLVRMGKKVSFLICIDGRFGEAHAQGLAGDALARRREQEARKAAKVLGVKDIYFLRLRDGEGYTSQELEAGIAKMIGQIQPDLIFGPDPCPDNECHADHLEVGHAVRKLACFAPYAGIMKEKYDACAAPVKAVAFYMTARPTVYVKTDKMAFKRQLQSIFTCHISQYPKGCEDADALQLYLNLRSLEAGLHCFSLYAEGFRLLTATHMHCLSEIGEM